VKAVPMRWANPAKRRRAWIPGFRGGRRRSSQRTFPTLRWTSSATRGLGKRRLGVTA
jgi:hypothetical protein